MTTTFSQSPGVVGLTLRQISAVTELFSTDQTDIRTADSKNSGWNYGSNTRPAYIHISSMGRLPTTSEVVLLLESWVTQAIKVWIDNGSSKLFDVLKMCLGSIYVCLSGGERAPQKKRIQNILNIRYFKNNPWCVKVRYQIFYQVFSQNIDRVQFTSPCVEENVLNNKKRI